MPKVARALTLTKLRAETGFLWLLESAPVLVSSVVGMASVLFASNVKTCTVPLSLETATYSGIGPLENATLKILAGSAPRLSSCHTHAVPYIIVHFVILDQSHSNTTRPLGSWRRQMQLHNLQLKVVLVPLELPCRLSRMQLSEAEGFECNKSSSWHCIISLL